MRGKKPQKRKLLPDVQFNSLLVAQLVNYVMQDGKKHIARKNVYGALELLDSKALKAKPEENKHEGPEGISKLEILETAINNIKPRLEIRSRRVGGANYQIPVPVSPERQTTLALRWIISASRDSRKNTNFAKALATQIQKAYNNEGSAIKKREDTQKMADANKAFAQFA